MRVRYREGLAIHPDPESCADVRKGIGEALTGADASRVLSGSILGSDEYVNRLKPMFHAIRNVVEISRSERLAARPSLELIFADVVDRPTRNACIYEATRVHGYTLKKVGNHLGLYYSTISTIAKRVAESETPRKKT